MKKIAGAKLKLPLPWAGRSGKEQRANNLNSKLSVNEEYKEAFRTESYLEMWSKVQGQLGNKGMDRLSSASSFIPSQVDLCRDVLEPHQETLINMMGSLNFHHLLVDYFESSLEACNVCEKLLQSIHQTRANYRKIKRVIKLSKGLQFFPDNTDDKASAVIYRELTAFALLKNPLSSVGSGKFSQIHESNTLLLHRLTSKHRKIRRRAKLNRFCKKVGGISLVISHSALVVALLIVILHSMVGIVAAPGLLACFLGLSKKRDKLVQRKFNTSALENLGAQVDVAAKGVYILINDFETMSRLVRRLHDEIEHRREVAKVCIKNGKGEVLKEVVKEYGVHESSFLEQLEELEERIYLCFHTINKSRRLVIEQILLSRS